MGGDRPSQTTHQTGSSLQLYGVELDNQFIRAGISPTTPPKLASRFLRLPAILHKINQLSLSSCSKGPRGLSVLPQVKGVFTPTTISLSLRSRQCSSRYAIRAGRNLPDKEFRYLRTVIVTAAVYRGFNSMLAHLLLTFRHRAGVRPYTSSYDFAESCVFAKQSPLPFLCNLL